MDFALNDQDTLSNVDAYVGKYANYAKHAKHA